MIKPKDYIERKKALCREILLADDSTFTLMEETMEICQATKIRDVLGGSLTDLFNSFLDDYTEALKKFNPSKGKKK